MSAVSWRTGTNVIAAANSQGMIKVSLHSSSIPTSHFSLLSSIDACHSLCPCECASFLTALSFQILELI